MRGLRSVLPLAATGLPPLLLAAAGLAHPLTLDEQNARQWHALHVVLLPLFPLLGVGPWLVARRISPVLGHGVGASMYMYAALYTGLDVLAGVGAGVLVAGGWAEAAHATSAAGGALGQYAGAFYLTGAAAAALGVVRQHGLSVTPGAVLALVSSAAFLVHHIHWPVGGLALVAVAVGWCALLVAAPHPARRPVRRRRPADRPWIGARRES